MNRRKPSEASVRAADRRVREDAAERLHDVLPNLQSLELAIEERRGVSGIAESRHVRRFPVERAPAMFELPCADRACTDGGHDITREVMKALQSGAKTFEGEHACSGNAGTVPCERVLKYVGTATWKA